MTIDYSKLARATVTVDAHTVTGPFEAWRHGFGHGAINSQPLPERVVQGAQKLQPNLVRIFLQEYFNVYPDHGVFNWEKLDAYMDSFARTGAKVLATINLKPPVLYPQINHDIWRPNDVAEWQNLIYQLVKRYSVERPIVTHWEHANETDIGESGACPYHMTTAEENFEFYQTMLKPVLEAFPQAKVGGLAISWYNSPILPGFIERCRQTNTQLDFVSWHMYSSDPEQYRAGFEKVRSLLDGFPGKRPEIILDEWNYGFDFSDLGRDTYNAVSVEEAAQESRRAAFIASTLFAFMDMGLDRSNYFLLWDNCCFPDEFKSFYSESSTRLVMYKHWNEIPARFGLFSEGQTVRPAYFVYQAMKQMGDECLAAQSSLADLQVRAVAGPKKLSSLIVNYDPRSSRDLIVNLHFTGLKPGAKTLTVYRIDNDRHWSPETLDLLPVERRTVATLPEFTYQFYSPADSILFVTLED